MRILSEAVVVVVEAFDEDGVVMWQFAVGKVTSDKGGRGSA